MSLDVPCKDAQRWALQACPTWLSAKRQGHVPPAKPREQVVPKSSRSTLKHRLVQAATCYVPASASSQHRRAYLQRCQATKQPRQFTILRSLDGSAGPACMWPAGMWAKITRLHVGPAQRCRDAADALGRAVRFNGQKFEQSKGTEMAMW